MSNGQQVSSEVLVNNIAPLGSPWPRPSRLLQCMHNAYYDALRHAVLKPRPSQSIACEDRSTDIIDSRNDLI